MTFHYPRKPSVDVMLRVVGLPGETLEIRDGKVFVNGKQIDEPYVDQQFNQNKTTTEAVAIPSDSYYVLGDNRDKAFDSRNFGPIPKAAIYGKFLVRYWKH